jgi:hypothetical protein
MAPKWIACCLLMSSKPGESPADKQKRKYALKVDPIRRLGTGPGIWSSAPFFGGVS